MIVLNMMDIINDEYKMDKQEYIDKKTSLHIMNITSPDVNNGEGIRVTVWVSGCTNKCPGCHNQHTWAYCQGKMLDELWNKKDTTLNRILDLISLDYIDGITISGGDPLCQTRIALNNLSSLLLSVKLWYPEKTIWLYTGKSLDDIDWKNPNSKYYCVLHKCDVVVDGPYKQELRNITLPFRGSTNQRIIDMKASYASREIKTIPDETFIH